MQKLELGRHNETYAVIKWLLEKRELGGGFQSTQATAVAGEALTRFSQAVPFEGVQDLRVQISAPKRAFSVEWLIDQNNAYQQRSAKFSAQDELEIRASGRGRGTVSILTMCHRSPESWEHTCNLFHLNVTLQNAPEMNKKGEETLRLRMETRSGYQDLRLGGRKASLLGNQIPQQLSLWTEWRGDPPSLPLCACPSPYLSCGPALPVPHAASYPTLPCCSPIQPLIRPGPRMAGSTMANILHDPGTQSRLQAPRLARILISSLCPSPTPSPALPPISSAC
ncbi:A.superbus venom factor 2-like isoform X1 [Equus quagga]|uniref:A.superbus venom factor 2-like isoform X1 n=1 Tax=Equus quagga TaxID=89248 RepID=UPI001EE33B13|nr:A.superbus venom factor 2-like isoform X1 [Equus quagga]